MKVIYFVLLVACVGLMNSDSSFMEPSLEPLPELEEKVRTMIREALSEELQALRDNTATIEAFQ